MHRRPIRRIDAPASAKMLAPPVLVLPLDGQVVSGHHVALRYARVVPLMVAVPRLTRRPP